MDVLKINWDLIDRYCDEIVAKMKDFDPQIIVGISRGGLVPSRLIADRLDLRSVFVIGVELYKKFEKRSEGPRITQEIQSGVVKGKKVLIVDDVSDSGETLKFVKKHVEELGAKEVRSATLHMKPNTKFKPDYFHSIESAWLEYPWETYELKRVLKKDFEN